MYIKYYDEWLHLRVREVCDVSVRGAPTEDADGFEGSELYDPTIGNSCRAEPDGAALRWFSSWAVACKVLDKLCEAIARGDRLFDLTAYGEDGEVID